MSYLGEYICKLDAKGRLTVPSGLKKQLDNEGREGFVLNRGFEGCLGLYPHKDWLEVSKKLNDLNLFTIKNRAFVRKFQNGATKLDMDGNGRVLLPKDLQEFAGISKEVVLFAYADRIEIWDKAKYDEVMNEEMGDFATLAEEVMSDGKDDEK
ncbi:MAG: division/cell wall cluster transcriptional repressor MraZ [Flavobacteriales bacterium]|jgi:MraZ protein